MAPFTLVPVCLASHAVEMYRQGVLIPPGTKRFSKSFVILFEGKDASFWSPPAPPTHLCTAGWAQRPAGPLVLAFGISSHAPPILVVSTSPGAQGIGVGKLQLDDGAQAHHWTNPVVRRSLAPSAIEWPCPSPFLRPCRPGLRTNCPMTCSARFQGG